MPAMLMHRGNRLWMSATATDPRGTVSRPWAAPTTAATLDTRSPLALLQGTAHPLEKVMQQICL